MLKVGDIVKMRDYTRNFFWYNSDIYEINSIDGDLCLLYNLNIDEIDNDTIDIAHLEYALKESRKMKLQKLSEEK